MILHHTHPIGQGNRLCHSPLTLRPQLRTYNRCAPMTARRIAALLVTGLIAGCALYSDVSISPLLVPMTSIDLGSDGTSMLRRAGYVRMVAVAPTCESKRNSTGNER